MIVSFGLAGFCHCLATTLGTSFIATRLPLASTSAMMSGLTSPSLSFDVKLWNPMRAWLSRSPWLSLFSAVTNALSRGEPLGLVRDVDRLELRRAAGHPDTRDAAAPRHPCGPCRSKLVDVTKNAIAVSAAITTATTAAMTVRDMLPPAPIIRALPRGCQ